MSRFLWFTMYTNILSETRVQPEIPIH